MGHQSGPLAEARGATDPPPPDRALGLLSAPDRGGAVPSGRLLEIGPFSVLPTGLQWSDSAERHGGWQRQTVASITSNRFSIANDPASEPAALAQALAGEGAGLAPRALRIDVDQSAAVLVYRFAAGPQRVQRLSWRWRADGFPPGEPGVRSRDDFAARLYLMFDYPIERVPVARRWLLRAARAIHDPALPAATLVYLLHDRPVGPGPIDSPYSSRVRMLLPRPQAQAGRWYQESRDLAADFQAAFGAEYGAGLPPIEAIAVGADGDQTGARFSAWFGDLVVTAG